MTQYEYANHLIKAYKSLYVLSEYDFKNSRLSFHDFMEINEIRFTILTYQSNGNEQSGQYIIVLDKKYFIIEITAKHNGDITWRIINE